MSLDPPAVGAAAGAYLPLEWTDAGGPAMQAGLILAFTTPALAAAKLVLAFDSDTPVTAEPLTGF